MNIIKKLENYNRKSGELKRLQARLKTLHLQLDNWDRLKAQTITDMPMYHDTENGDKIGDIVERREELEEQVKDIELSIAKLNEFIIDVDSRLDCLKDNHRFILEKLYKDCIKFNRLVSDYNNIFGIAEYKTVNHHRSIAIKEFIKLGDN